VKRMFVVIVMVLENHMLSCHIVIHKRTSWEKTFVVINTFLRMCESFRMSVMFVVLFSYGGEWCVLWS
jgi:hypothetical protein